MPERIDFANGDWIEWTYDANGTKLKKTTSAGNTRDYAGNVEYSNDQMISDKGGMSVQWTLK